MVTSCVPAAAVVFSADVSAGVSPSAVRWFPPPHAASESDPAANASTMIVCLTLFATNVRPPRRFEERRTRVRLWK